MAFPLGPNMAEEAARARATEALEVGIERHEPEEPEPEPELDEDGNPVEKPADEDGDVDPEEAAAMAKATEELNRKAMARMCAPVPSCERVCASTSP